MTVFDRYGLNANQKVAINRYEGFYDQNLLYLIVPIHNLEREDIVELKQLSDYLIQNGERNTAMIVPTKDGEYVSKIEGDEVIVMRCPTRPMLRGNSIGKELSFFHQKGRTFPYRLSKTNRIGQWKNLWEKRLDQMEYFWKDRVGQHPNNHFEKLFVESFPYYIGLTENAIQFLVDTELDEKPLAIDSATVCHQRFTINRWKELNYIKLPTDWVFDHPSRDLAELTRDLYMTGKKFDPSMILSIISDYGRLTPLSPFSYHLYFSRLLFPVHYFECIEGYYLTDSEEQKDYFENRLDFLINQSNQYERFLSICYDSLNHYRFVIKRPVEWLLRE